MRPPSHEVANRRWPATAAGAPRVASPRAKQQHQEDRPMANKTTASRKSDAVSTRSRDKSVGDAGQEVDLGRRRRLDPTVPNQAPYAVAASPPRSPPLAGAAAAQKGSADGAPPRNFAPCSLTGTEEPQAAQERRRRSPRHRQRAQCRLEEGKQATQSVSSEL